MTDSMQTNAPSRKSTAAIWATSVLIPVKQHIVCCGIVAPLVSGGLLGSGAAEWVDQPATQWGLLAVMTPAITYAAMWSEQNLWPQVKKGLRDMTGKKEAMANNANDITHKKEVPAHHHTASCDHAILTPKNYLRTTAIAYAFGIASHFTLGPVVEKFFPDEEHGHHHERHERHEGLRH